MKKIFLIINLSILLIACENKQEIENYKTEQIQKNIVELTDEQYKNSGIDTGRLSLQNYSPILKLNGKIDVPPQSMVSISVPLGGYLKTTKLLNGMYVKKGELLAIMEDAKYIQLQQDYLVAKSQLVLIESEHNRQKELNKSKATSDKIFDQTKSSYEMQLILIKSLEEKLKLLGLNPLKVSSDNISNCIHVNSPITGFVTAVNVNIGKYVNPTDVLFELVNPLDIHLALTVFEKDINKLSIGQKLIAFTNTNSDKIYNCKIVLISKNLSNNNSAEVHCHFEKYDQTLLPGMFMNAEIELSGNKTTALPEDAIVRFEKKNYVFLVKGKNKFEMKEVQTIGTKNGFTEIKNIDNLINQVFVTRGAYTLLMALKNNNEL